MPSETEVEFLAGSTDLRAAADMFMGMGAKSCVFKLGPAGVIWFTGDEVIEAPAFDIVPVDTLSCGDSLCAGLHAALLRGMDGREALDFACATGAQVALGYGPTGVLKGFEGVKQFARTMPRRA